MILEFKNIRLDLTDADLTHGISVTIGGETVTVRRSATSAPTAGEFHDDKRGVLGEKNHYRMKFSRDWAGQDGDRINAIKCVRKHLNMGLGDAKNLVEGKGMFSLLAHDGIYLSSVGSSWFTCTTGMPNFSGLNHRRVIGGPTSSILEYLQTVNFL